METAADTGQYVAQEVERFGAISSNSAEWCALFGGLNELSPVMLTDFQLIVFGRETVILIAIG